MLALIKPTLKSKYTPKRGRLLRLEDVIVESPLVKNLPLDSRKRYNVQEVIGRDDLAPSPKKILTKEFLIGWITEGVHRLNKTQLDVLSEWISNSTLADQFKEPAKGNKTTNTILPKVAPTNWVERTTGRDVSPVAFIKMHYGITDSDGNWDSLGLTRKHLNKIDPELSSAYASWVRPGRHPEDALELIKQSQLVDSELDNISEEDIRKYRRIVSAYYRRVKSF